MTRLWDKGTPLDARVLAFTAGDDYLLDNRLVRHDIQASIAHAEMLEVQGLLSTQDLKAIREALTAIGAEHALGQAMAQGPGKIVALGQALAAGAVA